MLLCKKYVTMEELIKKTKEYLDYVERHYNNVQKAWAELNKKLNDISLFLADDVNYHKKNLHNTSTQQSMRQRTTNYRVKYNL